MTLAAVLVTLSLLIPAAVSAGDPPRPAVNIQVLNVSDWHGNNDPVSNLGGSWNISARWAADRAAFDGPTLTLTAGDDFGASPPLSGFFDEVPAVKAERMMGIQVNTFGNHDFDAGLAHLQSMIDLAGAPSTGTSGDYPGQPFSYVAANLSNLDQNLTGVEPMRYFDLGGAKVAIIGIVNEEAPTLVSPGNFGTMTVTNGVAAAKKYAVEARKSGADAVIVITHKGVDGLTPSAHGPLIDFVNGLPSGLVDLVIGDHTNVQYSGVVNHILVHENLSYGQSYARTTLGVRPGPGGKVLSRSVEFVSPGPAGSLSDNKTSCGSLAYCDQDIVDMLVPYRTALAAALDDVIGSTTQPFDRGGDFERNQEVPLGDLIADGMRTTYGTDFGYMNSGGIRSQLPTCSYQPVDTTLNRVNWNGTHDGFITCAGYGSTAPYDIVKGDIYTVEPFGNNVLTRSITGIQLWQMLENGVSGFVSGDNAAGRFPQISGFKFTFDTSLPTGCVGDSSTLIWTSCTPSRVTSVSWPDGTPIPYDSTTYTVATIDFVNNGGDGYFMLADGQGITRDRDANVFMAYLGTLTMPLDPTSYPLDRITKLP